MARTNIDIDEAVVREVMRQYGFTTKREAVDYALRQLVNVMTLEEALAMRGSGWEGDLEEIRSGNAPVDWSDPDWQPEPR
jgi:Arc/MetJ family transcription regulator